MSRLLKLIPSSVIRMAGQLQFRYPWTKGAINYVAKLLTREGVIQRGAGKGLHFDARGCNPGYLTGTSEPLEQKLLFEYSLPGSTVYDLGANAGFYAIIAARAVGPTGRVFAFEPTPQLAERIEKNSKANQFGNLTVVQAAVANHDGEIKFGILGDMCVENSIRAGKEGRAGAEGGTIVPCLRIDTFCQENPGPNLLLIDIEGAEIEAILGAMETIRKHLPVMMVEVHWLGEAFTHLYETQLKPLGYTLTTYSGEEIPTGEVRYHALLKVDGAKSTTRV